MTNAFNWKQYTTEERAKCKEKGDRNTSLKRSTSSTKAVERSRTKELKFSAVGIGSKLSEITSQKPSYFNVFK